MRPDARKRATERNRPWPENAWPTAEQWLPWFLDQAPDEQLAIADMAIRAMQESNSCFAHDHKGRIDHLGAVLVTLDALKADLDAQAVQLDEIRRVATEWAEDDWPQVDDYLRGHAAGMRAAGGAILGRLG